MRSRTNKRNVTYSSSTQPSLSTRHLQPRKRRLPTMPISCDAQGEESKDLHFLLHWHVRWQWNPPLKHRQYESRVQGPMQSQATTLTKWNVMTMDEELLRHEGAAGTIPNKLRGVTNVRCGHRVSARAKNTAPFVHHSDGMGCRLLLEGRTSSSGTS